ncbi:hypothetical protein [Flavobacterium psychrotolerans]|uniref:Uncharacterized protein n=1 Tax=Flavobacterium psychrotolerans TaxID=2169410 RepID=A0A2U1JIH5_9FLAO|nr:hypothetical protein [Flavobacterium psychrotolerans]PWA04942.1 hypothetical protein DB895_09245 [Flavobacterium psychrotolerans]
MKKYSVLLLLLVFNFSLAQSINDYKYAIVPSKFNFLKETDQYRLNTLTKLFMEKYGFTTYLGTDVLPDELVSNNCNKIYVDVISSGSFLTTKLKIILKDCKNTILYTSSEGRSKVKEYKVAYNEALRMAFDNFSILKTHKFQLSEKSLEMIGERSSQEPSKTENPKTEEPKLDITFSEPLFAKPLSQPFTGNGFQLLTHNTNIPQYVMTVYKTSSPDCYIATEGNISGVLLRKLGNWYFEYYKENKLVSEQILIVNF